MTKIPIRPMVRASDIAAYYFCPVKVYLTVGLGIRPRGGREALLGEAIHYLYFSISRAAALAAERGADPYPFMAAAAENTVKQWGGLRDTILAEARQLVEFRAQVGFAGLPLQIEVFLESPALGLCGRIDLLEGRVPVEVKYKDSLGAGDVAQLAAYALLLRDCMGYTPEYGYIDLLKATRRVRVELGSAVVSWAEKLVSRVRGAALEPRWPSSPRCYACDLQAECFLLLPRPQRGGRESPAGRLSPYCGDR